ncbi:MAG: disulfide bond formation protein B [Nanoarchaeota archaeon]
MVQYISELLNILTLISDIILIAVILLFLYEKFIIKTKSALGVKLRGIIKNNYFALGLLISLAATLGSLYYSDILGYEPCKLCWYQRIFIYPQVLLFFIAALKRDSRIAIYSIFLSLLGGIIASLHYYIQITNNNLFSCSVIGYSASCAQQFFLKYGYITIPMMAVTAFIILILFGIIKKNDI